MANATARSRVSSVTASAALASTPLVEPLPSARAFSSELFPRITVNCTSCSRRQAVSVRSLRLRRPPVQNDGMVQLVCPFPRREHGGMVLRVERADVDVQATADGGDLLHFVQIVRHDGGAAAGQQNVGHVVDGDIIGDVVDQRCGFWTFSSILFSMFLSSKELISCDTEQTGEQHIRQGVPQGQVYPHQKPVEQEACQPQKQIAVIRRFIRSVPF